MALVLLAALGDAAGSSTLSFYLLLAAIPAIVVAGLAALEELVQEGGALPHRRVVGWLHVVTLLLVLIAAALRAPLREEGTVPAAAISAVVACLVVFAVQALIGSMPTIRRGLVRQRVDAAPVAQLFDEEALAEPAPRWAESA
jgi:hypothetical protein